MKRWFAPAFVLMPALALLLVTLLLSSTAVAAALPRDLVPGRRPVADPSALCRAAIRLAEAERRTPSGLLDAIAIVESGRPNTVTGKLSPWPWMIDANGIGHAYLTETAAVAAARRFQRQGVRSLDIGCMQVNLQQHPDAFASLAQAFSPPANALYAAGFLVRLKHQLGNWPRAIVAYHSRTPRFGVPYIRKVLAQWPMADRVAMPVLPVVPRLSWPWAVPEPKIIGPATGSKPEAVPMRRFGTAGFVFAPLDGQANGLPVVTAPAGEALPRIITPADGIPAGPAGRGLAAYRLAPVPLAGSR